MTAKPTALLVLALSLVLAGCGDDDDGGDAQPVDVKVMTRNVYLGADLTAAITAPSAADFIDENGAILRQVTANDFATRAQGLAAEILAESPDLVGLQEVALWRTGPASAAPTQGAPPTASTVRFDYLELLLDALNAGGTRYETVVVQEQFDFEAPADEDDDPDTGQIAGGELNGRLTMRDVILRRTDGEVTVSNPQGGNFTNLLTVSISGLNVTVVRGWTAVDARVRGSRTFRFVNTHLEAFDPATAVPSLRAQQASELFAPGGPATGNRPVVLLGDFNSDDDTVDAGDRQAFQALTGAGFVERSATIPLSCCIQSPDLTERTDADFDHQVDHILTRASDDVALLDTAVTGRVQNGLLWNSDHAGLWSVLTIR